MKSTGALWIALSVAAASLMALASMAGMYSPSVYADETASWAAQGVGQDVVNLFVVFPAVIVSAFLVARNSLRALLVWLGLLLYMIYSYLLYAFFVHFNRLFLVYVSVLGLAFWAFVGAACSVSFDRLSSVVDRDRRHAGQAVYLMASGVLFAALWLSDIVPAVAAGIAPRDVVEVGLPVNPVHVLDLAFVLPAMIVTSGLLWKRRSFGLFFAVPLMTFAAAMGSAIIGMSVVMWLRGLGDATAVIAVFVVLIAAAVALTYAFLRPVSIHGRGADEAPGRL
jgi:hypothetical protein